MDDWYPIFVQSNGRWIFVCWTPWQGIRNWIVKRLRDRGWNAQAFYQPNNFQRDPSRAPFPGGGVTNWQRVFYDYRDSGSQLLGYCGSFEMADWFGAQVQDRWPVASGYSIQQAAA